VSGNVPTPEWGKKDLQVRGERKKVDVERKRVDGERKEG
jgi:hypothetical protein